LSEWALHEGERRKKKEKAARRSVIENSRVEAMVAEEEGRLECRM